MPREVVDRYELLAEVASGGMAKVYVGRVRGDGGFARTVAIKRLFGHLAKDPHFVAMFRDEARLAAHVRHANVVSTLDVLEHDGEVLLVMDYVHGVSLAHLRQHLTDAGKAMPLPIVGAIFSGVLEGLHAAHEAKDESGAPLGIVHRDVSPQNILVGADGVARVVDFGVAKAAGRVQTTVDGQIKGKVAYMAPEQIAGTVDRRTDVFAASVVLWETLAGRRLFAGDSHAQTLANVLSGHVPPLHEVVPGVSPAIEELVMCGLDPSPEGRWATARAMDRALHRAMPVGSAADVAEWLQGTLGKELEDRAARTVTAMEGDADPPAGAAAQARIDATAADIPTVLSGEGALGKRSVWSSAAMLVAAAAFGALLFWRFGGRAAAPSPAPAAEMPATTAAPASAQSPSSAPTAEPPAGEAAVTAADAGAPRRATPGATPAKASKRPNCNPPYWVDGRGQHFKSECL